MALVSWGITAQDRLFTLPIIDLLAKKNIGNDWYNLSPEIIQHENIEFIVRHKLIWAKAFHPELHQRPFNEWEAFVTTVSRYYGGPDESVPEDMRLEFDDLLRILAELYAWQVLEYAIPIDAFLMSTDAKTTYPFTFKQKVSFDGDALDYIVALLRYYGIALPMSFLPREINSALEHWTTTEEKEKAKDSVSTIERAVFNFIKSIYHKMTRESLFEIGF